MRYLLLIFKNLRRNILRSALTGLAIIVLVVLFSMILTVLTFLNQAMTAQAADVALVLTERYRLPSRFDRRYMDQIAVAGTQLNQQLSQIEGFDRERNNVWHFVAFSLDPEMKDKELEFFVIATYPDKIKTMVDSMEDLDPNAWKLMKEPPRSGPSVAGMLMGPERLAKLNKRVGDVFKAKALSHREGKSGARQPIEIDFEIVGELPGTSRWVQGAFMDYAYLDNVLNAQKCELDGKVNLGWLKVTTPESAGLVSATIEKDISDIKSEEGSSAVSRFLDGYKDLLNGVRYVLAPAIVIVMIIIVANAIGITVRERMREMAVLKVLGFSPGKILTLVLGEALFLGVLGGIIGAVGTYLGFNYLVGGIKIPFAFFPVFFVPAQVFWWGPLLGAFAAFCGAIIPAWSARTVRVSEVFAKVA
jgi:putative ABC transport system permease protein